MPATILQDWEATQSTLPADTTPAERDYFSRQWLSQRKKALGKLDAKTRRTVTSVVRGIPDTNAAEPEQGSNLGIIGEQAFRVGPEQIAALFFWDERDKLLMDFRMEVASAMQEPVDFILCA